MNAAVAADSGGSSAANNLPSSASAMPKMGSPSSRMAIKPVTSSPALRIPSSTVMLGSKFASLSVIMVWCSRRILSNGCADGGKSFASSGMMFAVTLNACSGSWRGNPLKTHYEHLASLLL